MGPSIDTGTLEGTFGGPLVRRGDEGYDSLRAVFNGMVDRRPALFARCTSTRTSSLPSTTRARTGSTCRSTAAATASPAPRCATTASSSTSGCWSASVDPAARTALVQGGATWGDVDAATTAHGLAVTGGRVSTTGVGGLTLGSGSGWLERTYGLTCDSLKSCEVVTADGSVVRASDTENADLFWGLRGGSGNFGVVTEFEFALREIPPLLLAGLVIHPAERGADLLKFWRDFMVDAPDEVNSAVAFISAPPADFVPEPVRGHPVVGMVVVYVGDPDKGAEVLRPLLEWGLPLINLVQPMPYIAVQQMLNAANRPACTTTGRRTSSTCPTRPASCSRRSRTRTPRRCRSRWSSPGVARSPGSRTTRWRSASAQAPFNIHLLNMWPPDPSMDAEQIAWARDFNARMKPYARQGAYLNYLATKALSRVREAFGAEKFARLQALKDRYDPTNLFHNNQNIPPTSSA